MWLLDLLSEKGRARNKLRMRERFVSSWWDFSKIKTDAKKEKKLRHKRQDIEKDIKHGIEFFDADQTLLAVQERIDIYLQEHKILREMIYFANTEEYRLVDQLHRLRHRLGEFNRHHPSVQITPLINELDKKINDLKNIIKKEKDRARDLTHDREHWRDKSILPFMMIYHKIRRMAREGKREAKKLKKVQGHIEHTITLLDKGKIDDVAEAMQKLHKELNLEEQEMIEEIKDLAQIERFIEVLQFREGEDDIVKVLEKLQRTHFPKLEEKELEEQLRHAHDVIEELHREERFQIKAVDTKAKKIA